MPVSLGCSPCSIDISPDGRYVLAGTAVGEEGEIFLWDFTAGEELHRITTHQPIYATTFSADSRTVYFATSDGKLFEWNAEEISRNDLLEWITANRYVRPLTCEERYLYHVLPLCRTGEE